MNLVKNVPLLPSFPYCISVHAGLPASSLKRLQRILHASARLVFGARKRDHVHPLLHDLGWLSIRDRIDRRLATLVFLCRKGLAPSYLSEEVVHAADLPGRACLRSSISNRLFIPRFRRPTFGGRTFGLTAARAWNRLPSHITSDFNKNESFKALLKL